LGNWKEYNCPMKWTEDHVWVLEKLTISSQYYF
jgi:hypothetical protein